MYQYPDYLMHYGVLGMKWGQLRARKYAEKAKNMRTRAKNYDIGNRRGTLTSEQATKIKNNKAKLLNKSEKYKNKSKKIESYHRSMAGDKAYDLVKAESIPALVGEIGVLGTYGSLKFNQALAAGQSGGKAFIKGFASNYLNNLTGGILSVAQPRIDRNSKPKK